MAKWMQQYAGKLTAKIIPDVTDCNYIFQGKLKIYISESNVNPIKLYYLPEVNIKQTRDQKLIHWGEKRENLLGF